jgi:hypothetical protein
MLKTEQSISLHVKLNNDKRRKDQPKSNVVLWTIGIEGVRSGLLETTCIAQENKPKGQVSLQGSLNIR